MAPRPKFRTLCDVYEASVKKFSARPLFGLREGRTFRWLSYRDFASQVEVLRSSLSAVGVRPGDRVALIAPNSAEWAMVAFATFTAGAVLVPIYPFQRYDDWLDILRDCRPKLALGWGIEAASVLNSWRSELPADLTVVCMTERGLPDTLSLEEFRAKGLREEVPSRAVDPDELATLIYTSGTTGLPKGVELTHRNIASNLSALHQIFPVTAEDRSLAFLPWAHAFGQVVELYGLFSVGASLAIAPSEDELVTYMREVQPTLLFSVPKLFNRLYDTLQERVRREGVVQRKLFEDGLDNARLRRRVRATGGSSAAVELKAKMYDRLVFQRIRREFGGNIRYAVSGGAQLAPEVAEFVDSLGITLYEGYGLTEASPIVSANWPGARKLGSVGKPLPGVKVTVDHSVGPNSRDGEILVEGDNVMRGYYGAPEDTNKVLADGVLRTGDLGYLDRDGFLFVTGRLKEQYKLENGRYVVPSPLEAELRASRFIRNVMVTGDSRPYNVALIVPEHELLREWAEEQRIQTEERAALVQHPEVRALFARELEACSDGFRQFEKIRDFVLLEDDFTVEEGTLTHTLKLKRREITERYGEQIDTLYGVHRGARRAIE